MRFRGRLEDTPDRAGLRPLTLAFRDADIERGFQVTMGRDGIVGFRLSRVMGILLWLIAAWVVPTTDADDPTLLLLIGLVGASMNLGGLVASRWTDTLDRQNALGTVIAIIDGACALALVSAAGVLAAYGTSALILVGVFFVVARVRFVFAMARVLALLSLFAVVAATQTEPRAMVLDAFILSAAMGAVLLGLFRMELTSRRLYRSELAVAAQSRALAREHDQVQALLIDVLPTPIADRLRAGEDTIADEVPDASVLFADLTGFTSLAHAMAPAEVVRHLDSLFTRFDIAAGRAGVEKIKTIGDAYMAVGGIPQVQDGRARTMQDHPARMVALGLELIRIVDRYAIETGLPFALRVGVHTGPLVAGVIGTHRFQYDLWGDTVNVASRLESTSVSGTVQVSQETRARVDGAIPTEPRGLVLLDGVGMTETWLVRPRPD